MLSISTNSASSIEASEALLSSLQRHQKSYSRLSSGSRIADISEDSAGFAVSFTLNNTSLRSKNVATNIASGLSFLEQQAAGLDNISDLVGRMSELAFSMADPAKIQSDTDTNQEFLLKEFNTLRENLYDTLQQKFNDQYLFATDSGEADLAVSLSADGQKQISLTRSVFTLTPDGGTGAWATLLGSISRPDPQITPPTPHEGIPSVNDLPSNITDEASWGISGFSGLMEDLARMIADNASQQSQLRNALDNLTLSDHHLSDANSRIYDVDVAREVSHMARNQLLIDASASAMAQSNVTSAAVLKIITG